MHPDRTHSRKAGIALLGLIVCLWFAPSAHAADDRLAATKVNDWGSGFTATFEYEVQPSDVADDLVRDWRIEIDYDGDATLGNTWMSRYAGTVRSGLIAPDGGYAVTNAEVGYRLEIDAGERLTLNVQGRGAGYHADDFDVRFVNLTRLPTNDFTASLVGVND